MKEFNYYSGDDIERPSYKTIFDFTTITAELKNVDGETVDTIIEPLSTPRIKQLNAAGYKITQHEDTKGLEKFQEKYRQEMSEYKAKLYIRKSDFAQDIAKEFKITLDDVVVLIDKVDKISKFFVDYVYDNESFRKVYPNEFKLYYELIKTII